MNTKSKNHNENNFIGTMNFNGTTQIAAGDIINNISDVYPKKATYIPEPIWRSPFTLAVLTWISVAIGIIGLFPFGKIVKCVSDFFNGNIDALLGASIQTYLIAFAVLFLLFVLIFSLRTIAKNQTRHPLVFGFAISGYGRKLTLEKIHAGKCPKCGGKMKYYNKPIRWRNIRQSNGSIKREIIERASVLECKRNAKHYYFVDPAEDKII